MDHGHTDHGGRDHGGMDMRHKCSMNVSTLELQPLEQRLTIVDDLYMGHDRPVHNLQTMAYLGAHDACLLTCCHCLVDCRLRACAGNE